MPGKGALADWWGGVEPPPETQPAGPSAADVQQLIEVSGNQLTTVGATRLLQRHQSGGVQTAINAFFDMLSRDPERIAQMNCADPEPPAGSGSGGAKTADAEKVITAELPREVLLTPEVKEWIHHQTASVLGEGLSDPVFTESCPEQCDAVTMFPLPLRFAVAGAAAAVVCCGWAPEQPPQRLSGRKRASSPGAGLFQRCMAEMQAPRDPEGEAKRPRLDASLPRSESRESLSGTPGPPPPELVVSPPTESAARAFRVPARVSQILLHNLQQQQSFADLELVVMHAEELQRLKNAAALPGDGRAHGAGELGATEHVRGAGIGRYARGLYHWSPPEGEGWMVPGALLQCCGAPRRAATLTVSYRTRKARWAEPALRVACDKVHCIHVPSGHGPPIQALPAVRTAARRIFPDTALFWCSDFAKGARYRGATTGLTCETLEEAQSACSAEAAAGGVLRQADGAFSLVLTAEAGEEQEVAPGEEYWARAASDKGGYTLVAAGLGAPTVLQWVSEAAESEDAPVHCSLRGTLERSAAAAIFKNTGCLIAGAEPLQRPGEVFLWQWCEDAARTQDARPGGRGSKDGWHTLTPQQSAAFEDAAARLEAGGERHLLAVILPKNGLCCFELAPDGASARQLFGVRGGPRTAVRRGAERSQVLCVSEKVRVRPGVSRPMYSWGSVKPGNVGVMISVDGCRCKVRFPSTATWRGHTPEMERAEDVPGSATGVPCAERYLGVLGPGPERRRRAVAAAEQEARVHREMLRVLPYAGAAVARGAAEIARRCGLRSVAVEGPGQVVAFGFERPIARLRQLLREVTRACGVSQTRQRLAGARDTILWELRRVQTQVPITPAARGQLSIPAFAGMSNSAGVGAHRSRRMSHTSAAAVSVAVAAPQGAHEALRAFGAARARLLQYAERTAQRLRRCSVQIDSSRESRAWAEPMWFTLPFTPAADNQVGLWRPKQGVRVRVRACVRVPALNWGHATPACEGVVTRSDTGSGLTTVDFAKNKDWNGLHCELEALGQGRDRGGPATPPGRRELAERYPGEGHDFKPAVLGEVGDVLARVLDDWVAAVFDGSRPRPGRPSLMTVSVRGEGTSERKTAMYCPTDRTLYQPVDSQPEQGPQALAARAVRLHWVFGVDLVFCATVLRLVARREVLQAVMPLRDLRRACLRASRQIKRIAANANAEVQRLERDIGSAAPSLHYAGLVELLRSLAAESRELAQHVEREAAAACAALDDCAAELTAIAGAQHHSNFPGRCAWDELRAVSDVSGAFCDYRPPDHCVTVTGDEHSVRSAVAQLRPLSDSREDYGNAQTRDIEIDSEFASRLHCGDLAAGAELALIKRGFQLIDAVMVSHATLRIKGTAQGIGLAAEYLGAPQQQGGGGGGLRRSLTAEWGRPGAVSAAPLCEDGSLVCDCCATESPDEELYDLLCGHRVHPSCMREWARGRKQDLQGGPGDTGKFGGEALWCPARNCRHVLTPKEYIGTVGSEGALENLEAQLHACIQTHDRVRRCRKCAAFVCAAAATEPLFCSCGEVMCSRRNAACGDRAHYFTSCEEFVRARAARLRRQGKESEAAVVEAEAKLPDDIVACARCQSLILRDDANERCKYMHCRQCDYEFCWKCLQPALDHRHVDPENPNGAAPACDPDGRKERQEKLSARGGAATQVPVWRGLAACIRCREYPLGDNAFACLQCLSSFLCARCEPQGCPTDPGHVVAALPQETAKTATGYDPLSAAPRCRSGHMMTQKPGGAPAGCDCIDCTSWQCNNTGGSAGGCGKKNTGARWVCTRCSPAVNCCNACAQAKNADSQTSLTLDADIWDRMAKADPELWKSVDEDPTAAAAAAATAAEPRAPGSAVAAAAPAVAEPPPAPAAPNAPPPQGAGSPRSRARRLSATLRGDVQALQEQRLELRRQMQQQLQAAHQLQGAPVALSSPPAPSQAPTPPQQPQGSRSEPTGEGGGSASARFQMLLERTTALTMSDFEDLRRHRAREARGAERAGSPVWFAPVALTPPANTSLAEFLLGQKPTAPAGAHGGKGAMIGAGKGSEGRGGEGKGSDDSSRSGGRGGVLIQPQWRHPAFGSVAFPPPPGSATLSGFAPPGVSFAGLSTPTPPGEQQQQPGGVARGQGLPPQGMMTLAQRLALFGSVVGRGGDGGTAGRATRLTDRERIEQMQRLNAAEALRLLEPDSARRDAEAAAGDQEGPGGGQPGDHPFRLNPPELLGDFSESSGDPMEEDEEDLEE
eukprot:TRINITY_DN11516_c0_g1_i1.p1 TRINITY_DN11516_c0_g1~~TRINITY_DN11516_c0_g1_i1.p1  ORF type:complete len:2272 (+),score=595.27 TRINITY_DN11516_c0_g1_i1:118-6816(+)